MSQTNSNFIQDFVEYNSGNECPPPFVLWTAYSILAAAAGHKIWHCQGDYFFVRCDTYTLLVGESGDKKTSSMDLGVSLFTEVNKDAILSSDNETYQGLLKWMGADDSTREYFNPQKNIAVKYKPYHIFASEFMDFINNNPDAMLKFLTGVKGRAAYRYRLGGQEDRYLINPYITLLGCTTFEWLVDQIKTKQFRQGIGRRLILVCNRGFNRKEPIKTPAMEAARVRCLGHLERIKKVAGQVKIEPAANVHFWQSHISQKRNDDRFIETWKSSLNILVMQVAILTSLAERSDLEVHLNHILCAQDLLGDVERRLEMLTPQIGKNESIASYQQIIELLQLRGGEMPEKDLKMLTLKEFKDPIEQWRAIEFLKSTGQLVVDDRLVNGVKRKFVVVTKKG